MRLAMPSCILPQRVPSAAMMTAPTMTEARTPTRQFQIDAMVSTITGAVAEPRWPEKVWMEKERPSRASRTVPLMME